MVTIIFKAIEKCVSNCVYCEVIRKKQNQIMSYEIVECFYQKINTFLLDNPYENVEIVWHGGEVCLLGQEYFNKVIEIQSKSCIYTTQRIKHAVQSNLLIIDQNIIESFKILGISSVGTSFDPINNIRGVGEKRNSNLYNTKFFKGIMLLKENNINWGIINVVHKMQLHVAEKVYLYLTNLCTNIQFNKVYINDEKLSKYYISPSEYGHFLGRLFPLWLEDKKKFDVSPFSSIYDLVYNHKSVMSCDVSGNCANRWMYIGPTGETSHCGRAGDNGLVSYGNIVNKSLTEIFYDKRRREINKRNKYLHSTTCKKCRFWGLCHGGCPIDAKVNYNSYLEKGTICESIKIFMEEYFEPLLGVKVNLI